MNLTIKKIGFYLIGVYSLFIIESCRDEIKTNRVVKNQTLHFDVSNWNRDQTIPQKIIKKIKFIPLETKDDCLIGSIGKIYRSTDLMYIKDNRYVKKILVYNNEGKYLKSIGNYGKGAGEFIGLADFTVDERKNRLLVLDNQQRKVLTYDLDDGSCLNEMKINFWATNFAEPEENVLSFYSKDQNSKFGAKYSIANLDLKDNSYKWFLEQDECDTNLSYHHSIFQSENTYFAPYFKDVVYRITKDNVEPFITFDFGANKIPKEKLQNNKHNIKEIVKVIEESDWSYGIKNVIENEQFLIFNFKLKKKTVMVIYSKETGNYHYGNCYEGGLGAFMLIENIATSNNEFIGVVDAFMFKKMGKMIIEKGDEELKDLYLQTSNMLSEQSNPVIISIEYNQF
ncbi:MAG: 6-bladed beta-propeller [Mangrovibacterium sp.]